MLTARGRGGQLRMMPLGLHLALLRDAVYRAAYYQHMHHRRTLERPDQRGRVPVSRGNR